MKQRWAMKPTKTQFEALVEQFGSLEKLMKKFLGQRLWVVRGDQEMFVELIKVRDMRGLGILYDAKVMETHSKVEVRRPVLEITMSISELDKVIRRKVNEKLIMEGARV